MFVRRSLFSSAIQLIYTGEWLFVLPYLAKKTINLSSRRTNIASSLSRSPGSRRIQLMKTFLCPSIQMSFGVNLLASGRSPQRKTSELLRRSSSDRRRAVKGTNRAFDHTMKRFVLLQRINISLNSRKCDWEESYLSSSNPRFTTSA